MTLTYKKMHVYTWHLREIFRKVKKTVLKAHFYIAFPAKAPTASPPPCFPVPDGPLNSSRDQTRVAVLRTRPGQPALRRLNASGQGRKFQYRN